MAMECVVALATYLGAAGLAGWPSQQKALLLAGWTPVLMFGAWLHRRGAAWALGLEALGLGAVLGIMNGALLDDRLSLGQMIFATGWVTLVIAGWRAWLDRSLAVAEEPLGEPIRVLLVATAALGVVAPLFTPYLTGGTDARWYAYMMHDFIDQWRTFGPPVWLGQGEFVWNGAVHPFRSAPVYMHAAGVWDWLTLQSLSATALHHLAAVTATIAGGWGMYGAGVTFAPRSRWTAAWVAVCYVLSPGILTPLYMADAYMTHVASAVFVWVFYANAKVLIDGRGWVLLAAALSLAWMSHPPTALQVTILSLFLQTGGLVFGRRGAGQWRRAAVGGVLFLVFSAYYFVGMSELPREMGNKLGKEMPQLVGLLVGWASAARVLIMRRDWRWGILTLAMAGLLWVLCPPWAVWLAITAILLGVVRWWAGKRTGRVCEGRGILLMLGCIVLAAYAMDLALRRGLIVEGQYPQSTMYWASTWASFHIRPLVPLLHNRFEFEPGWGLWLGGVLAGALAWRRQDMSSQLFFGAMLLMVPFLMRWPAMGDFFVEYIPDELRRVTAIPMHLRSMPVFSALLAMSILVALRGGLADLRKLLRAVIAGGAVLAVGWYVWQARVFVGRGIATTSTAELSERNWRTENAPMDRFVYDLLPIPRYFSHGKMDPRFEVRLLTNDGQVIYGPPQITASMEEADARSLELRAYPIPEQPRWMQIEPGFAVAPGEHVMLRFEFDPERRYDGYLFFHSENGYREYALPESGFERAFGAGERQSKILSLWNSGKTVENYKLSIRRDGANDLVDGAFFARLTLSRFDPSRSLIQVESLNPWRVRTSMPWSGQLETPRVFLPGYEVRVNGRRLGPSRVSESSNRLLQIAMPPGEHRVEVRYTGTWRLRAAGLVSGVAWLGLIGVFLFKRRLQAAWPTPFETCQQEGGGHQQIGDRSPT